jgi:uncharacterized protein DUF3159
MMTTQDATEEELPSFAEQLASQLGGIRGVIESGIPVLVFVIANILFHLTPALIISVASAVLIAVWRLARRQSVRHAVNGLFGIAIGAILAWKTGTAKAFYLPGILLSAGIGQPLVGWAWSVLAAKGSTDWRDDRRLVRLFNWLTVLWAVTYLTKVGIQAAVFQHTSNSDPGTVLGILRLALGYPPYLMLIAVTVWAVRRVTGGPVGGAHRA